MSALADTILVELQRHRAQPFFNLRCICGYFEKTVSELGDFERHVSVEIAAALSAAGLATVAPEESPDTRASARMKAAAAGDV